MIDGRVLRAALLAFFLSRAVLFLLFVCGSQIEFLGKAYGGTVWETRIVFNARRIEPELTRLAMVGDAWFYNSIATRGYDRVAPPDRLPTWAFFPLYPLLVRAAGPTGHFPIDGVLISNVAFAAALVLLGSLLLRSGYEHADAERAIWYLAFFPTSYFFSMPITESFFLLLSLGAILAALAERWWLAGLMGGLAALTRWPGMLLIVPLAILFFESRKRKLPQLAWLLLVPAGTAAFMAYLWRITGDAFAIIRVQQHWGRSATSFWSPIAEFLANPATISAPWNPKVLNLAMVLLVIVAAALLLAARRWAFGAYALACVLLPLSSGSLQSMHRYVLVIFPLFAWLAFIGRRPNVDRLIMASAVALFGWLAAFFTLRVDFALA